MLYNYFKHNKKYFIYNFCLVFSVFLIALLCLGCTKKIEKFMSESSNQFAFDLYKV